MRIFIRVSLVSLLLLVTAGCGGFQLNPVTPERGPGSVLNNMPIAIVNVNIDPGMAQDQRNVLEGQMVPAEMQRVLISSLGAGAAGGATVNINLTSIRYSAFGPTRMHSTTAVVGPDGSVLKTFESESMSMRSKALVKVAQDHVRRIANGV